MNTHRQDVDDDARITSSHQNVCVCVCKKRRRKRKKRENNEEAEKGSAHYHHSSTTINLQAKMTTRKDAKKERKKEEPRQLPFSFLSDIFLFFNLNEFEMAMSPSRRLQDGERGHLTLCFFLVVVTV